MRGATVTEDVTTDKDILFQSTLLMRGATVSGEVGGAEQIFQSTLLMRGATTELRIDLPVQIFQSTLLMRGATLGRDCNRHGRAEFQSTLLMRGATIV